MRKGVGQHCRRIDTDQVKGYVVAYRHNGRRVEIFFGDATHGGRGTAYRQASKVSRAIKTLLEAPPQ